MLTGAPEELDIRVVEWEVEAEELQTIEGRQIREDIVQFRRIQLLE